MWSLLRSARRHQSIIVSIPRGLIVDHRFHHQKRGLTVLITNRCLAARFTDDQLIFSSTKRRPAFVSKVCHKILWLCIRIYFLFWLNRSCMRWESDRGSTSNKLLLPTYDPVLAYMLGGFQKRATLKFLQPDFLLPSHSQAPILISIFFFLPTLSPSFHPHLPFFHPNPSPSFLSFSFLFFYLSSDVVFTRQGPGHPFPLLGRR